MKVPVRKTRGPASCQSPVQVAVWGASHMAEAMATSLQGVSIMLVVEHALLRDGMRAVLERERDLRVVGEAPDALAARSLRLDPAVVVLDVGVPGVRGLEAIRQLGLHFGGARLLGLSLWADGRQVQALLAAGARACLVRGCSAVELISAVRAVARGEPYAVKTTPPLHGSLSPREREVLQAIAEGLTSKEIAARLEVAVSTVDTYRKQIMLKLELHTVAALTKFAVRTGLSPPE